jgi:cbb3-type cytochrome oxidase subunit 3
MLSIDMILTIVMFTIFIVIVIWAWSPGRKKEFDEAGKLALESDDITPQKATPKEELKHG